MHDSRHKISTIRGFSSELLIKQRKYRRKWVMVSKAILYCMPFTPVLRARSISIALITSWRASSVGIDLATVPLPCKPSSFRRRLTDDALRRSSLAKNRTHLGGLTSLLFHILALTAQISSDCWSASPDGRSSTLQPGLRHRHLLFFDLVSACMQCRKCSRIGPYWFFPEGFLLNIARMRVTLGLEA